MIMQLQKKPQIVFRAIFAANTTLGQDYDVFVGEKALGQILHVYDKSRERRALDPTPPQGHSPALHNLMCRKHYPMLRRGWWPSRDLDEILGLEHNTAMICHPFYELKALTKHCLQSGTSLKGMKIPEVVALAKHCRMIEIHGMKKETS